MKKTGARFNPETDDVGYNNYEIENFHGVIVGLQVREGIPLKLKKQIVAGVSQKVFSFEVAVVGTNKTGIIHTEDGNSSEVAPTTFLETVKGTPFRTKGTFFCDNPPEKAGWVNKDYVKQMQKLGIFPTGDAEFILDEIEEEDVIGLPVLGNLELEHNNGKTYTKVGSLMLNDEEPRYSMMQALALVGR